MTTPLRLPQRLLWFTAFCMGLVALCGLLLSTPDLRGWPPASGRLSSAIIQPTLSGHAPFRIADCVPGSVRPYDLPRADEYAGSASVSILSCRSRSSAWRFILSYIAIAVCALTIRGITARRNRSRGKASTAPDSGG